MGNRNGKPEENIRRDIVLINKVAESADLKNLQVRIALFHGIREGDVFHSTLGNAFLASLVKDNFYGRPGAAGMVIHDLNALGWIMDYMKCNSSPQVVERMKEYRFQSGWIQEFVTEYLDGCCRAVDTPEKEPAEVADLKKIRRLVRLGNAGEPFPYDAADALMEKHKDEEIFHSWIGKFFQEAVHARTTAVKKKGRMKKSLGDWGWHAAWFHLFSFSGGFI